MEEKLKRIKEVDERHKLVRAEIDKILKAVELLEKDYHNYLNEMYSLEKEYVDLMKEVHELRETQSTHQ